MVAHRHHLVPDAIHLFDDFERPITVPRLVSVKRLTIQLPPFRSPYQYIPGVQKKDVVVLRTVRFHPRSKLIERVEVKVLIIVMQQHDRFDDRQVHGQ